MTEHIMWRIIVITDLVIVDVYRVPTSVAGKYMKEGWY